MKHIVIIGGGPAGVSLAQTAAKKLSASEAKITLLEKQEYQFNAIASLRASVDPSFVPKLFIPYDDALKGLPHAEIKHAAVKEIEYASKTVTYTDPTSSDDETTTISYDYLVIATGSSYPSPIKPASNATRDDVERSLHETADHISKADRILIVGGGAVGIEMAGEIKFYHPSKSVTLVDGNTELVSHQNVPKLRRPLRAALEKLGVELRLGERLTERFGAHRLGTGRTAYRTRGGATIEADALLVCAGMTPNVDLMTDAVCLTEDGRSIRVKDNMEVDCVGYEDVYVLGDASDHPSPKMWHWAAEQGKHLGKALAGRVMGGTVVPAYDGPSTEMLAIPLGPEGGVAQLPLCGGVIVGDFMTRNIKSKGLFVSMMWGNLNATVPKNTTA